MPETKVCRRTILLGGLAAAAYSAPVRAQDPRILRPGGYIRNRAAPFPMAIDRAPMNMTAIIDKFGLKAPLEVTSYSAFASVPKTAAAHPEADAQVRLFFENGGKKALLVDAGQGDLQSLLGCNGEGLEALRTLKNGVGLLAIPAAARLTPVYAGSVYQAALPVIAGRYGMLLIDAPPSPSLTLDVQAFVAGWRNLLAIDSADAALFAPRLNVPGLSESVAASAAIAGVISRVDTQTGVWKSPAGLEATLNRVLPAQSISDAAQGILNEAGVNAIRSFPSYGVMNWGARTLSSDPEWKYIAVRRLGKMIEKSVLSGLAWTKTEENNPALRAQIEAVTLAFFNDLYREGAFVGAASNQAFFVKCDASTTTSGDINKGVANLVVGFAPLKPAEFVVQTIALETLTP